MVLNFLEWINSILWNKLLIFVFLGMGLYFTIITRFIQIRKLPLAIKQLLNQDSIGNSEGDITPLQALYVAISSCVGNGNIVGVATSISAGGPGAIFWMWIAALLGAATKYSEILLGMLYREKDSLGNYVGGPIYYIRKGLKKPNLALTFAVLLIIQSSGGNLIQSNALSSAVLTMFNIPKILIGIILAITVSLVIVGGFKGLVSMTEKVVPLMAILYIASGIIVIIVNIKLVPMAFVTIFKSALNIKAGL